MSPATVTAAEYYGLLVRVARVEVSLKTARAQLAALTERVTALERAPSPLEWSIGRPKEG